MCGEVLSLNTNTEISLGILHSVVWGFFITFPTLRTAFLKLRFPRTRFCKASHGYPCVHGELEEAPLPRAALGWVIMIPPTFTRARSPACSEEFARLSLL